MGKKIIIFVIIILIVIAGGIFWWQTKKDETANWQVYRNEEYGFEFRYPQGWKQGEYDETGTLVYDPEKFSQNECEENSDRCHYAIGFVAGQKISSAEFETIINKLAGKDITVVGNPDIMYNYVSSNKLGGVNAYKIEYNADDGSIRYEIWALEEGKNMMTLTFEYFGEKEYKDIFNQILSTFKFIDQTADWQTYRNEEYGYEIKYPPGWTMVTDSALVQPPDIELQKEQKNVSGDFSLLITQIKEIPNNNLEGYVQNLSKQPDEAYEKYCSPYLPRLITLSFKIDGEKAFRMYSCGVGGGIPSEETFISDGKGGIFRFSCLLGFEGYPDYSKYYSSGECDKMLKTFKTF